MLPTTMKLRSSDLTSPSKRRDDTTNDDIWEDVTPTSQPHKRSESPSSQSQSPARRRRAVKTVFVAAGSPRRRATKTKRSASAIRAGTSTPKPEPAPPVPGLPEPVVETIPVTIPVISKEEITNAVSTGARHTGSYVLDVFTSAIRLLRRPLSFILFLWLLATLLVRVNDTLRTAFAPLCYLPGVSRSAFCAPPPLSSEPAAPRWADFPHLMDAQSGAFEQLLDASAGGSALALEIKKAEMATTDLSTLVRVSNLRSRDLIADTLSDFVEDARKTGRGLQRLSAKVGGAVDGILAVNDYALHTIEGAAARPPSRIAAALALVPYLDAEPHPELVTQTFTEAMDYLAASLARLVVEAQASLANLDALEQRLNTLNEVIARENVALSLAQSELLAELWTKLGGNRRKLQGHGDHLALLKGLGHYRRRALAMSEDMQDMRERVAAPELVGSRVPVEVHIRSIRSGLERLKEGRVKAKEREEEAIRKILTIA
ncbi:hypothetical protein FIBSPDRAFT_1016802 [Athelia psychrophila]|uniref:Uncharacterized protein n=1 Tax=Athelia psychrophila TaxID=1759441 RepID=A0A166L3K0_9AGAM|nr:hypothetical protein FIBSPDRAFT_1016802 [Fibularhizoctonia sp. CBS 109695]